jgi:hypothetical protein
VNFFSLLNFSLFSILPILPFSCRSCTVIGPLKRC